MEGRNVNIDLISYLISITQRVTFFYTKKQHDYKCEI